MNRFQKCSGISFALAGLVCISGCSPILIPAEFNLNDALGTFDVAPGQTARNSGTGDLGDSGITIGSGNIELNPDAITFTPDDTGGGKTATTLQDSETILEITVRIDELTALGTVCTEGEEYGPFEVTLDSNNVPISIEPSTVTLSQNTIDLLNSEGFSICLEVESTEAGTVEIHSLTFNLGL